jgi:integral membrane protein
MLKFFKIIALLEGTSLLLLLGFAMPMKYFYQDPIFVKTIGMAHGFLFIAYLISAVMQKIASNWSFQTLAIVSIASVFPFGTFYVDKKYLK